MTISVEEIKDAAPHGNVVTEGGDKVGGIGQVYVHDSTGNPAWVTVKTGLFGTAESFVPLTGARVEGNNIVVAFDKQTIKDAPRVEADGALTPDEEQALYRHYGLQSPGRDEGVQRGRSDRDQGREASLGDDTSTSRNRDDDNVLIRSEEQLRVGTETQVAGRAVLRKYVVTEYVTQTVPVRREEVRLEHEPISDADRGRVTDAGVPFEGGDVSDLYEVVLHREVPVVQTEIVAVERVRLRKVTLTEQATVSDQVRKEKLDLDVPESLQSSTGDRSDSPTR